MITKLSAAALLLMLAVPVLTIPVQAETTATISNTPADPCADAAKTADGSATATDCPAATPGKLGSAIKPLAGSDHDAEGEDEDGEDGDKD